MNTDFRLQVGFLDHPKIVKLQRRYGDGAVLSLIRLWSYTAMNKPDGKLYGMDDEDIEIASSWEHSDSMPVALNELGLLKKNGKGYVINDWEEHNPWAANAEARSEQARMASKIRWEKNKQKQRDRLNAASMLCVMHENADSNAPFLSFPFLTLPNQLSTCKAFADAWVEWETFRKEKRKKLTESTVKKQISMLSKLTPEQAVETINQSITNGWVGLFPDKVVKENNPWDVRNMKPLEGGMGLK